MKTKITYEIDLMEEEYKFYQLIHASNMAMVLKNLDDRLRALHKYEDKQWAWDFRQELHDYCADEGFFVDTLWD